MDGVHGGWRAAGGGSALVNVCRGGDKREFSGGQILLVTMRKAEDKRLRHAQQGKAGERGPSAKTARAAGEWPCADRCVRAEGAALVKEEGTVHKQEHGGPDGRGGLASALAKDEKKEGNQQDAEPCLRAGRPRGRKGRSRSRAQPATLRCPWCGERFERHASRQRFCGKLCRRQWDNMRGCAERERARLEREAEAEEQRWRDLERERIHAGLLPWPEGLACRDGISPWERDQLAADTAGAGGIWENALLDPLPVR